VISDGISKCDDAITQKPCGLELIGRSDLQLHARRSNHGPDATELGAIGIMPETREPEMETTMGTDFNAAFHV
jgi:hypothetical protein